ncbi:hypothetical protein AVEN_51256-1 [Araneus ventricosus]|uniref:Uncharacterized protein n=1 Tax=Araneus ventricosus TaxID=182803 RepID=A0A4Y2U4K2_ARAVE|nr:hypothetical protein AVEN_51256-1 [Araneus ventricosus]
MQERVKLSNTEKGGTAEESEVSTRHFSCIRKHFHSVLKNLIPVASYARTAPSSLSLRKIPIGGIVETHQEKETGIAADLDGLGVESKWSQHRKNKKLTEAFRSYST